METTIEFATLAALTLGLTEAVKVAFVQFKKPINQYIPLVAVAIGVGLSFVIGTTPVEGIIAGLTAVGLFGGTKSVMKK